MAKLAAYGVQVHSKEERDAEIAKEKARAAEVRAAQAAKQKRRKEAEAEEARKQAEAAAREEELASAPLVDDWMAAADDWSQINVEALDKQLPVMTVDEAAAQDAGDDKSNKDVVAAGDQKANESGPLSGNALVSDHIVHQAEDDNPLRSPICHILARPRE